MGIMKGAIVRQPNKSKNSAFKVLTVDGATEALNVIDYVHHEIHEGSHYHYSNFFTLAAKSSASSTAYIHLAVPNTTKWPHITMGVGANLGLIYARMYEGITFASAASYGSVAASPAVINNNRNVTSTNGLIVYTSPTIASLKTQIMAQAIGTTGFKTAAAGTGTREDELLLKQNTRYAIALANQHSAAQTVNLSLNWYEHTHRN